MQEISLEHIVCSRYWGARDIYVKFLKREKKIPCPWSSGEVWDLVPCHMQWKSAIHYDNGSDSNEDRNNDGEQFMHFLLLPWQININVTA